MGSTARLLRLRAVEESAAAAAEASGREPDEIDLDVETQVTGRRASLLLVIQNPCRMHAALVPVERLLGGMAASVSVFATCLLAKKSP